MNISFKKSYDISLLLGEESFTYPGDPSFLIEEVSSIKNGDDYNLTGLSMSLHEGTHIDFPSHYIEGGKSCDAYKAEQFIMPANVVEIPGKKIITKDDLKNLEIKPASAILFKTDNSKNKDFFNGNFTNDYCSLDESAADKCLEKNPFLIGIDALSIDAYDSASYPAHKKLLSHNILILESINLNEIEPGEYSLICMPLKLGKVEASPVRAVLFK